jgi:hypothetical protein
MTTTSHEAKALVTAWAITRFAIVWIVTSIIVAGTVLSLRWMNVTLKSPPPRVQVDTVRSIVYDSVIVISRAKDTVRVVEEHVGPLTEQRLARLVCGSERTYGDERDLFAYNYLGMVFCPNDGKKK